MTEDKETRGGTRVSNIEEILQARERLEEVLKEKYRREVTILFTDICGYTQYLDKRGDISGRTLLLKHNRIVLPPIERHHGKVIEIIGDAVMASFANPLDAVKSAIAIQNDLEAYNRKTDAADRIHVKIGINSGEALVDEGAVFQSLTGDVANVASRIQGQAGKDQILISRSVFNQVCGSEDLLCRLHGTVQVKGKADPIEIYRVVWRDEEVVMEAEPRVRLYELPADRKEKRAPSVFHLEITGEADRLKISAHERLSGAESTIRHYEEVRISMASIQKRCEELVETLNKAHRRGRVTRETLVKLREIGQVFYDELFTLNVKEKLKNTRAEFLSLHLDDQLVHIPWELLYDGQRFLCQAFNMGRLVKTRQNLIGIRNRALARPLKMLILADPRGDLKGAYAEGTEIRDDVDRNRALINVTLRSDGITPDSIKEKLRNFDIVHFAGHADYNAQNPEESGWRLSEGSLRTRDIVKMAGTAAMPALIFSNACQSARTEEWALAENFQDEIFGLANAFLVTGVRHYIGTFWEILDDPGRKFALEFYKSLFSGISVGEAMREARAAVIKDYGEETIVWASYLLYGDPTFNYMDQITAVEMEDKPAANRMTGSAEVRTGEEVIDFAAKVEGKKQRWWWAVGACVMVLAAILLWGYPGILNNGIKQDRQKALAYFEAGNYGEAARVCEVLQERNPRDPLSYLILGTIHFSQGDLKKAQWDFKKALDADEGANAEKAKALLGMGRIASIEGDTDRALELYRRASKMEPESRQAYVSQALLLDREGRVDEALALFNKARSMSPGDPGVEGLARETQEKAELLKSKEKQEKVDRLVKELIDHLNNTAGGATSSDDWTSPPLTLWIMDLESVGHGMQEGEERLIASGMTQQLIEKSRVQIVDRAIFDKLLEELKLSRTKLVDPSTALSLGRVMAARLISTGKIVRAGAHTQVALRLIETETGRVVTAVSGEFENPTSASAIAESLVGALSEKIDKLYPLRGKVVEARENGIVINIGRRQGVQTGQAFKVIDTDAVLEVSAVEADHSILKSTGELTAVKPGLRVEALDRG